MAKKKAFGIPKLLSDGIGETINTGNNNVGQLRYEIVALSRIDLDSENPRDLLIDKADVINGIREGDVNFDRKKSEVESLQTLSFSIKKAGVRNPIELYKDNGRYVLISGERRVLSSLLAGKTDIPAKILESKPDEMQLRFLQWIENIEREDLNIWERLHNIDQLVNAFSAMKAGISIDSDSLSEIIGCSKKQSKRYLDVLTASDELKASLKQAGISDLIKLSMIASVKDKNQQSKLIEEASKGASRDDLSSFIQVATGKTKKIEGLSGKSGRGRPRTSVALNIPMEQISTIKMIFETVLSSDSAYGEHKPAFHHVDWSNANQIKKAFQSLLNILDKNGDKNRNRVGV